MSGHEGTVPRSATFSARWPDTAYASLRDDVSQGLRLLRLLNNTRRWVHTRAESVHFHSDRLVHRRVSVDFTVPASSPVLERGEIDAQLIPLTLLSKNTLINFDLRDEGGDALSILGIRQTQALTYGMLHAWCRIVLRATGQDRVSPEVATALRGVAGLTHRETVEAWQRFGHADPSDGQFHLLYQERRFRAVLNRFANSFVLLVPLACHTGVRRTLKFAYDEPLSLKYFDTPPLSKPESAPESFDAVAPDMPSPYRGRRRPLRDAIGLSATPVRFPVPAAEHCHDYYFEVTAPEGTQIERSSLIADRLPVGDEVDGTGEHTEDPDGDDGEPGTHVWFDAEAGDLTRVTLHVADVPDGAVCYGQTHLRLANDGWIRRAWYVCASSAVILLLIFAAALSQADKLTGGINVALSFVALVAGGLSIVLASPAHPMEARLLKSLRLLTTVVAVLPLVATFVMLVESIEAAGTEDPVTAMDLLMTISTSGGLFVVSVIVTVLVSLIIYRSQHPEVVRSVWSQSAGYNSRVQTYASFWDAVQGESYDTPAVVVVSGEGERAVGDEDVDSRAKGLTQQINQLLHEVGPVIESERQEPDGQPRA